MALHLALDRKRLLALPTLAHGGRKNQILGCWGRAIGFSDGLETQAVSLYGSSDANKSRRAYFCCAAT
jgi:hypothetical protein